jgi:outer membrane protein
MQKVAGRAAYDRTGRPRSPLGRCGLRHAPVFVLLSYLPAAWCQTTLTLDDAVQAALQNNHQVRAAKLEISKAEAAIRAMQTYRLPSFSFRVMEEQPFTHINFDFPAGFLGASPMGPIPATDTQIKNALKPMTFIISEVAQPISQLHRINISIGIQSLNREEAAQKLAEQQQSIAGEVKKTYYGMLQSQSMLNAMDETLKLFRELQRVAEQGVAERLVLPGEVLEVKTRLARAELERLTLRDAIETQKSSLNLLLARPLDTDFRPAPPPQDTDIGIDPAAARSRALTQRPEREEARLHIRQAEQDVRLKRAEYIPEVSASIDYIGIRNLTFPPHDTVLGGVTVKWDVFDWGRKKDELAAKRDTVAQAKEALAAVESQIQLEVDTSRRKLEQSRARLKVTDLSRQTAAENLRVSMNQLEEKTAQMKDLLQTQAAFTEATQQYQNDLVAFWSAKAEFDRALGEK